MLALTYHRERVSMAGSRMASRALSMLLPSGPLLGVERVEAEKVGLASAMAGVALDLGYGLHAVVDVQFLEDVLQVVLDGEGADGEDAADLGIGLAHPDPVHDLGFALAQSVVFADLGFAFAQAALFAHAGAGWPSEEGHDHGGRGQGGHPAQGGV